LSAVAIACANASSVLRRAPLAFSQSLRTDNGAAQYAVRPQRVPFQHPLGF
jgi:hypothetical protein